MFVTRITFRGLTQICGTFGIHFALLVCLLMFYPDDAQMSRSSSDNDLVAMSDNSLRTLMIWTHTLLILSTLAVA